jgi:hypothetical protein
VSGFILMERLQTLEIKMQRKCKYQDKNCSGCKVKEESGEDILTNKYYKW